MRKIGLERRQNRKLAAWLALISGSLSEDEPIAIKQTENQIIMNKLEIKGDWNITKGKLQQKWAKLTDDDLQYVEGKQEELLGRIQKRTGETREAVEKAIKESCSTCCCK